MNTLKAKPKTRITVISVAAVLLLWETVSLAVGSDRLPDPWKTILATGGILSNLSFLKTVGQTLLRSVAGFAIAISAGGIIGIISGLNSSFRQFMKPWIVVIRSTPVVVFVLLAIVLFSADTVPVLIGTIMIFPIVYLNISEGIKSIDPEIIQMARFYNIRGRRLVKEVYIPAIKPFVMSGISTAVGLGWRAIVAAEVLSHPKWGIGTSMHSAQIAKDVDVLMAWAVVTVVIGAVFERLLNYGYRSE